MSFLFTPQQCFVIAIVAFGAIGFWRGWRREVISLAFALTGVLFLLLNGGNALAQLAFVKTPIIIHDIFSSGPAQTPSAPSPTAILIVTLITFVVIVVAGYLIGNRAFPAKNLTPAERLLGVLPGLVTGYFLITYIANIFAKNPLVTVGFGTPTQNVVTNYVPILIIVAIVVVVAGLIASRAKKPSAPPAKK
jgi:ABC-type antimicrobial peptide transport system permease subunit